VKGSVSRLLRLLALSEDVLIFSDPAQVVSLEGLQRFDPHQHDFVNTELRLYYVYFNRRSTFTRNETVSALNYYYNGAKIITYRKLKEIYGGQITEFRRRTPCSSDVLSKTVTSLPLSCSGKLIGQAGWQFTLIVGEEGLRKEYQIYANTSKAKMSLYAYIKHRMEEVAPNGHPQDLELLHSGLPTELVISLLDRKAFSLYYPYTTGLPYGKPSALNTEKPPKEDKPGAKEEEGEQKE
jgi:hypothetical protein